MQSSNENQRQNSSLTQQQNERAQLIKAKQALRQQKVLCASFIQKRCSFQLFSVENKRQISTSCKQRRMHRRSCWRSNWRGQRRKTRQRSNRSRVRFASAAVAAKRAACAETRARARTKHNRENTSTRSRGKEATGDRGRATRRNGDSKQGDAVDARDQARSRTKDLVHDAPRPRYDVVSFLALIVLTHWRRRGVLVTLLPLDAAAADEQRELDAQRADFEVTRSQTRACTVVASQRRSMIIGAGRSKSAT